jgi:hypothetical protein
VDFVCRRYSAWQCDPLEHVTVALKMADRAKYRELGAAKLVKDVLLDIGATHSHLHHTLDFVALSQPFGFANAPVLTIELPARFGALTTVSAERCTIMIAMTADRHDPGTNIDAGVNAGGTWYSRQVIWLC